MFSHLIMFIGAFISWVRHPSILFTFIFRRCNAFIINVIVVIRRSIIFTEHFLWQLMGKNFHPCSIGFQHVMLSKWVYFNLWAMIDLLEYRSSQPDMVVGRLEQISSHGATFGVLFLGIWLKVSGDGHHWLLCHSCYTTCMCSVQLAMDRIL